MTAKPNDHDREALSALFDGELSGDAARFALKRLGHDAQWRDAFGRWQLCGDVLRGQASAVATGDFANRVTAAIALEQVPTQAAPVAASRPTLFARRRGWIGGALAASVAAMALFIARPLGNGSVPATPEAPTQVANATAPARTPSVGARTVPRMPVPTTPAVDLGTAAIAAAEVPRRVIERRSSTRSQNQRRASVRRAPAAVEAIAATTPGSSGASPIDAIANSSPGTINPAANPFLPPQHNEVTARPWPRATLPQYSGTSVLNASFGGTSPSFYPFEPSMQAESAPPGGEPTPSPR